MQQNQDFVKLFYQDKSNYIAKIMVQRESNHHVVVCDDNNVSLQAEIQNRDKESGDL